MPRSVPLRASSEEEGSGCSVFAEVREYTRASRAILPTHLRGREVLDIGRRPAASLFAMLCMLC